MKTHLRAALFLLALSVGGIAAASQAPAPNSPPGNATERKGSSVKLYVEHDQPNAAAGASFKLTIEGWEPSGHISLYLIGPKGEEIAVIPKEHPAQLKQDGIASFTIPYKLRGLYPGQWQLVVVGESGVHIATVVIPAPLG